MTLVKGGIRTQQLRQGHIPTAREKWNNYSQVVLSQHDNFESIHVLDAVLPQILVRPFVQNWLPCGLFQATLSRPFGEEEYVVTRSESASSMMQYMTTNKLFAEFVSRRHELCRDKDYLTSIRKYVSR
jgi:hypothetical protein